MNNEDQETIYRSPISAWRLRIIDGFDAGQEIVLTDTQEYTIGRKDCDINVNPQDMKTSRLHARLEFKNGQPFLENLSRTTDTYVNNSPIKKKRKLKPGNKIGVGDTLLVLERTGDSKPKNVISVKYVGIGACIFISVLIILKMIINTEISRKPVPPEPTPSKQPIVTPMITDKPHVSTIPTITSSTTTVPHTMPIDREKADELFRQGKIFYKSGRLKKAISYFELALENYRDHPYASDHLKEARADLDKKVTELMKEAEKAQRLVNYHRAKLLFREIVELLSDNPQDGRYVDAKKKLNEIKSR